MKIMPLTDEELEAINEVVYQNKDMVNAPSHYQSETGMECWQAQLAAVGRDHFISHCQCNAIKYLWRWREKGGTESLKKARWYIDKMLELSDGQDS